jgi:hypothetical protein
MPMYGELCVLRFASDECFIVLQPLHLVLWHSRRNESWQKKNRYSDVEEIPVPDFVLC